MYEHGSVAVLIIEPILILFPLYPHPGELILPAGSFQGNTVFHVRYRPIAAGTASQLQIMLEKSNEAFQVSFLSTDF